MQLICLKMSSPLQYCLRGKVTDWPRPISRFMGQRGSSSSGPHCCYVIWREAIGSWICIHVTNFWGCSGSNTFANLSNSVICTFVVKMSHLRAFVVKSSPTIHEHSPKNCHLRTFCVKMSRVAFTRFCREIHQSARIGVRGGGQASFGNARILTVINEVTLPLPWQ